MSTINNKGMLLTVFSFSTTPGMEGLSVGDKVVIKEDMESSFKVISVYKETNNQFIGNCSESSHMLLPNCVSLQELLPIIEKEKKALSGTVYSVGHELLMKNNRKAKAIIIKYGELEDECEEDTDNMTLKFKIAGTVQKCPGKPYIIKERKDGNEVEGHIELTDDNKIAFCSSIENKITRCGFVTEVNKKGLASISDIEDIKKYLKDSEKLVAVAKGEFTQNTYEIEIQIENEEKEALKNISIDNIMENINKDDDEEYIETVKNIISYLQNNGFSSDEIEEVINSHDRSYSEDIKARIPKEPKIKYIEDKSVNALKIGYGAIKMGWHLLARGHKGSGKNEFTKTLAWIYQKPLYDFTFNRDVDKIDLQGGNTLESVEENGVTKNTIKFAPEILLEAMECGGIFVADEINFAEPSILGLLNPVTDTRGAIQVPAYKQVKAKKGFCLIGTMNEGYEGTNELNQALNDRFIHIPFKVPNTIYPILKQEYPNVKDNILIKADNIYKKITYLADSDTIDSDCVTIRGFIQAIPFIDILGEKNAFITCVANKVLDERYREDILACINETIK